MNDSVRSLARLMVVPILLLAVMLFAIAAWIRSCESRSPGGAAYLQDLTARIRAEESKLRQIATRQLSDKDASDLRKSLRNSVYKVLDDRHGNVYFITDSPSIGSDWGFVLRQGNAPLSAVKEVHVFDDWWHFVD